MIKNRTLKNLYLLLGGIFLVVGLIVMMIPMMKESKNIAALIIGGLIFIFGIVFMVMFLKKDDSAQTEEEKQIEVLTSKFGNLFGLVSLGIEAVIYFVLGTSSLGKILLLASPTIATVIITVGSKENIRKIQNKKQLYTIVLGYLILLGMFNTNLLGLLLVIVVPFIAFVVLCNVFKSSN